MNTKKFNENYEIDRKSKGARAVPKFAHAEVPEILTADGTVYDRNQTYFFFEPQAAEVRQSSGLRRDGGEHLCAFGLKVAAIASLRAKRDDALADGQSFFNAEIEQLRERVRKYEAEKTPAARSLKAVLMSR